MLFCSSGNLFSPYFKSAVEVENRPNERGTSMCVKNGTLSVLIVIVLRVNAINKAADEVF